MKEHGELRKRLSGKEADPYMGYARKLLGMMKESMQAASLQQLQWVKNLANGVRVMVSSVHGQDEVQITVPVTATEVKEEQVPFEVASFEPYLWVGVRRVDTDPANNSSIYLYVWEPDNDTHKDFLSNSIVSERANTNSQSADQNYPIGDNNKAGAVSYNDNQLIAYADYTDKDNVLWEHVVIGDDDRHNIDMRGFKTKFINGTYQAAFCVDGDDCTPQPAITVEIKVILGKGEHAITYSHQQTFSEFTNYKRAIYPYGYFGYITPNNICPNASSDNGTNPHQMIWMQKTLKISVPIKQREVNKELLIPPMVSLSNELPSGFDTSSSLPSVGQRCPLYNVTEMGVLSVESYSRIYGDPNNISMESYTLYAPSNISSFTSAEGLVALGLPPTHLYEEWTYSPSDVYYKTGMTISLTVGAVRGVFASFNDPWFNSGSPSVMYSAYFHVPSTDKQVFFPLWQQKSGGYSVGGNPNGGSISQTHFKAYWKKVARWDGTVTMSYVSQQEYDAFIAKNNGSIAFSCAN